MSFSDYLFNEPYARCSEKKDAASIRYLESDYLQTAREDLFNRNDLDLKVPATPDTVEAALALRHISVPHNTSRAMH
jgi:hypothetical protein